MNAVGIAIGITMVGVKALKSLSMKMDIVKNGKKKMTNRIFSMVELNLLS